MRAFFPRRRRDVNRETGEEEYLVYYFIVRFFIEDVSLSVRTRQMVTKHVDFFFVVTK